MAEKEVSPRESRRNLTLSTLEKTLIQNTLGANLASDVTKYGTIGKDAAKSAFDNEEIKKEKEAQYKKLSQEYDSLGVVGNPTYPSDSDISYHIIQGLEQVMQSSYLEDIAESVNKFTPELKFELPDQLKGMVYSELIGKSINSETGKPELDRLSNDEKVALSVYENLREAYRLTAAEKVLANRDYLGDVKQSLNAVMEKYNPTPKEDSR